MISSQIKGVEKEPICNSDNNGNSDDSDDTQKIRREVNESNKLDETLFTYQDVVYFHYYILKTMVCKE
jgi:hypothetical protein